MAFNKHTVVIIWSDEDESFIGLSPEFEGLSVVADTRAEALAETEQAIEAFLQIYKRRWTAHT